MDSPLILMILAPALAVFGLPAVCLAADLVDDAAESRHAIRLRRIGRRTARRTPLVVADLAERDCADTPDPHHP